MKLFIVEDSEVVRERLATMLGDIANLQIVGYARDASGAAESFSSLVKGGMTPDAAVLDIRLAKGNGMGVLRFIKSQAPATKVIMLTNFAYPQYRKRCLADGADYFFDKSSEFMKMREVLEQMAKI